MLYDFATKYIGRVCVTVIYVFVPVTIIQRSKWSDLDIVNQTYDYDDLRISEHIEDVDSSNLQDFVAKGNITCPIYYQLYQKLHQSCQ